MLQKYFTKEIPLSDCELIIEGISKPKLKPALNFKEFYNYIMPSVNKHLRLKAIAREQMFVHSSSNEFVELFTEQLIHKQIKIHLLITDLFLQEIKLQKLLKMKKFKVLRGAQPLNRILYEYDGR